MEAAARKEVQTITVRAPTEVHQALRTVAFATGQKMNDLVLRALHDFLADTGYREMVEALGDQAIEQYRVALDKLANL